MTMRIGLTAKRARKKVRNGSLTPSDPTSTAEDEIGTSAMGKWRMYILVHMGDVNLVHMGDVNFGAGWRERDCGLYSKLVQEIVETGCEPDDVWNACSAP